MSIPRIARRACHHSRFFNSFTRRPRPNHKPWRGLQHLEQRLLMSAAPLSEPIISELMAINDSVIFDLDGDSSDWIEIHNPTPNPIDLDGWHLTDAADSPAKWTFPQRTLAAGEFLLVFASGKDLTNPANELHTNFQLDGDGEYLALVRPDQTIAFEFDPEYPKQQGDISYGPTFESAQLITPQATAAVLIPTDDSLGLSWTLPNFNTGPNWFSGPTGIGYDTDSETGGGADPLTVLQVDFNNRQDPANTQSGFSPFTIDEVGGETEIQFNPTVRNFDGVTVILSDAGTLGYDDRLRAEPANAGAFDQGQLLQDFIFSRDQTGNTGIDLQINGLTPGQPYDITLWSFDDVSTGNRASDWTANGVTAVTNYTFDGAATPPSNETYTINVTVEADELGQIDISGRRNPDSVDVNNNPTFGVFLNALQIQTAVTQNALTPILQLDIGDDDQGESGAANTEPNFSNFTLADNGTTVNGVTVTLNALGGASLDDRDRSTPTDTPPNFTLDQVYDDFVFANGTFDGAGMSILLEGLTPNALYQVQLRTFDTGSTGIRQSDWIETASGVTHTIKNGHIFDGSNLPNSDTDNTILATLTASPAGTLQIEGRRNGGTSHGVFLNSLEVFTLGIGGLINTDIEAEMFDTSSSALIRLPFTVDAGAQIDSLSMGINYDAGFVAYLNGTEVARRNAPGTPSTPLPVASTATTDRSTGLILSTETISLNAFVDQLILGGENVLAIHGLNSAADHANFLISPTLIANGVIEGARFFAQPTPGAVNVGGFLDFVKDTTFSIDRGFYDAPFDVEITSDTPGAQIWYTTDGSEPAPNFGTSILYTDPVNIATTTTLRAAAFKTDFQPTNIDTQTYIFLDHVLQQDPPVGGIYPATWQGTFSADYAMDPRVITQWDDNDPNNTDFGIRESLQSIPTISIVMDHDDIWNTSTGLYTDARRRILKPGSIEYFDPNSDGEFQVDAGIQMHGGASRDNARTKKHSFRFRFREDFGPGRLNFPLFDDTDIDSINTVVMKSFFTDGFPTRTATGRYSPLDSQYTRDTWMRDVQRAMGSPSAHSTYTHLYVNGLYWGLYSPTERPDDAFLEEQVGGNREDYDVVKDFNELFRGNKTAWDEMFAIANAGLADNTQYNLIQGKNPDGADNPALPNLLDVDNLIDFMMLHFFGGAEDWPHHNWYAARDRVGETKGFQFMVWDQEIVLDGRYRDRTEVSDDNTPARLYSQLRANEEFRQRFADRIQMHMFNDGALTVESAQQAWMRRADQVEAAIIAESARWGDAREGEVRNIGAPFGSNVTIPLMTVDIWREERDNVHDNYFQQAWDLTIQRFIADGLFPSIDAPTLNQHGGTVPAGFELEISNPNPSGTIYYTLNGEDPRLSSGSETTTVTLVPEDASKRVIVPDQNTPTDWLGTNPLFDDSTWALGTGAFGYDENTSPGTTYYDFIDNAGPFNLEPIMNDNNTSAFARIPFIVDANDLASFNFMNLNIRFDDGFTAYLNGQRITGENDDLTPAYNSNATDSHSDAAARTLKSFNVSEHLDKLVVGENLLAIHGQNVSITSSDFLISAELVAGEGIPAGVNPNASQYDGTVIDILDNMRIKARVFSGDEWSALTDASFALDDPNIAITEINFNPAQPTEAELLVNPNLGNDDFEFIEITNNALSPRSLDGFSFIDGIDFTFPENTILQPGEHAILVRDLAAFDVRYDTAGLNILGEYNQSLSNNGEDIILVDPIGAIVFDFEYNDGRKWPIEADGHGATLELIDPDVNYSDADNWRASYETHGTPGFIGIGAEVDVFLVPRNSPTPSQTSIPTPLTDLPNVPGGEVDDFWVREGAGNEYAIEVWVKSDRIAGQPDPITQASLTLEFDPLYASALAVEFGSNFSQNQLHTIDLINGTVDFSAATPATDLGDDEHVLLARILFSSQAPIDPVNLDFGPFDTDLDREAQPYAFTLQNFGPVPTNFEELTPDIDTRAVIYDFDNSGAVNFADLALLLPAIGRPLDASQPPYATWADFNNDQTVDESDLNLLLSNFAKSFDQITIPPNARSESTPPPADPLQEIDILDSANPIN